MDKHLIDLASELGELLMEKSWTLTTAESCTSGWVGSALAAASDSSRFYSSGFITYTNQAKQRVLGVKADTLARYTAVSEETVREMACGAKKLAGDSIGLATSGYAGPDGGEDGTPAGTVWFAWCLPDDSVHTRREWFSGESEEVVYKATCFSLSELKRLLSQ
ncbi:CinA family protein [Candidatus Pantoea soli]|uniref:Nicotinamide-nucleotide amidohydrolase family protein n=1 Tax=Candidatus Pantoea soli TaxID=3098669 RepID=A0A518XC00_9GAMM|nr:nicotinamide-nucleotide amidohydrolase family protein [Pantoea soli]QDY41711.1 nicotinamide-nucleotide amidohydrolase family protein [Pantoea soli]